MSIIIVATVGPLSSTRPVLKQMILAGMNVARINCSHATPAEIRARVRTIRTVARSLHRRVDILLDLQGPRLRVTNVPARGRVLRAGELVVFDTRRATSRGVLHIDDPYLHQDIHVGHPLFLANGQLELTVERVFESTIHARVVRGGTLFNRKGVNVPHTTLTTSGLTDKDRRDVEIGLAAGVDMIGLSFVQTAQDIRDLRQMVRNKAQIVAKIEMAVALSHLTDIIRHSDGVMVARGDLGCEVPMEDVPFLQKKIIKVARRHKRWTIVATQMMLSMMDAPHPTRAEVSDVANAVLDGAHAVMLSDETAMGKYPVESVATMQRITRRAEAVL